MRLPAALFHYNVSLCFGAFKAWFFGGDFFPIKGGQLGYNLNLFVCVLSALRFLFPLIALPGLFPCESRIYLVGFYGMAVYFIHIHPSPLGPLYELLTVAVSLADTPVEKSFHQTNSHINLLK